MFRSRTDLVQRFRSFERITRVHAYARVCCYGDGEVIRYVQVVHWPILLLLAVNCLLIRRSHLKAIRHVRVFCRSAINSSLGSKLLRTYTRLITRTRESCLWSDSKYFTCAEPAVTKYGATFLEINDRLNSGVNA